MASVHLLVVSCVAEIITAISFFTIASIYESFDKSIVKSRPRLRVFQLGITGAIVLLCTAHAGLLAYPSAFSNSEADTTVACALFVFLAWVILLLPLIDRKTDAGYPHYISWTIVLVFEIFNSILILGTSTKNHVIKNWIDYAVVISRLVCIFVLVAGSVVTKYNFCQQEIATPEETEPLLDVESSKAKQAASDKKDEDKDDDGENEEDEEDEEWKDDLAALKTRSWSEYLASFKIFIPHLRPRTKSQYICLAVMLVCTGIGRVLIVLTPSSLGWVVNDLQGATKIPWKAMGAYLGLYLINSSGIVSVISGLASVRMSSSMRMELDNCIYNHIMNMDAKFHDAKRTATLGRITDRGDSVIDLFQDFFFELMPTISDLFISLAVLQYLFGAYVCFIAALTGVLFAWSNTHLIKNRTSLRRKHIDAWCAVYDHSFETQFNWTTVSHFGRVEHEQENFRNKNDKKVSTSLALTTYSEVTRCTRQLIMTTGFIFAILLAANQVVRGHRQVGDFVMLVSYWSQVMSPVRSIINSITSVSERLVDAEKLLLLLEKTPSVKDKPDAKDFEFKGGSVVFEGVTFSYDGERTVSEGITFHADAGQTIALVGETGGGKSTLLKLLFRFYDPASGRILVDGQDIKDCKAESFRNFIGIVPQDPALFNRSVFENIRYHSSDTTEEEVIEACKGVCLHDKVMTFTKQYQEKVGERGTKLSGGECQRLAIARAILKKPKMLLLDEATSSVDSITESKIQACLKELCKGRTTFIIAHRLSTILHADQIMVIKGGKLMEMGPHRELFKKKGAYRELWDAQLNIQAQSPGGVDEDETDGEGEKKTKKKTKKNSMFWNDMGKDEINETMLLTNLEDIDNENKNPSSSGFTHQNLASRLATDEFIGSEDATEIGSGNNSDSDKQGKSTKQA